MRKKKIIMPRLYNAGGDINKQWFVYYSYRDQTTDKMKRFQASEGLNKLGTVEARTEEAKKLIAKLRRKLKNGYNPFEDDRFIYQDAISYSPLQGGKNGTYKITEKKFEFSIEQYLSQALVQHKPQVRYSSFQQYKSHVRNFLSWLTENNLEEIDITELTLKQAQQYLNELSLHKQTKKAIKITLSKMFKILKKNGVIDNNIWVETELQRPVTTEAKRAFKKEERELIKNHCLENGLNELWMAIQLIFYCGIRPGKEATGLIVANINFDNETITVPSKIAKNRTTQYVIIPNVFVKTLKNWVKGKDSKDFVFSGKGGKERHNTYFWEKHNKVLRELEFDRTVSIYSWRHTLAVEFLKKTKDPYALMNQLRHHSLDQLLSYVHSHDPKSNDQIKHNFPEI